MRQKTHVPLRRGLGEDFLKNRSSPTHLLYLIQKVDQVVKVSNELFLVGQVRRLAGDLAVEVQVQQAAAQLARGDKPACRQVPAAL